MVNYTFQLIINKVNKFNITEPGSEPAENTKLSQKS